MSISIYSKYTGNKSIQSSTPYIYCSEINVVRHLEIVFVLEARGGTEVRESHCANNSVDYLPACVTNKSQSDVRALLLPTVCWTNGGAHVT